MASGHVVPSPRIVQPFRHVRRDALIAELADSEQQLRQDIRLRTIASHWFDTELWSQPS